MCVEGYGGGELARDGERGVKGLVLEIGIEMARLGNCICGMKEKNEKGLISRFSILINCGMVVLEKYMPS